MTNLDLEILSVVRSRTMADQAYGQLEFILEKAYCCRVPLEWWFLGRLSLLEDFAVFRTLSSVYNG